MLFLIVSCSVVNQKSDEYIGSKRMRHGVIPLEAVSLEQLDQAAIDRGEKIYMNNCVKCHGKSGEGDGVDAPPNTGNLRQLMAEVGNFKFYMSVSQSQGEMPGWKTQFTELESDDLVAYIKSLR